MIIPFIIPLILFNFVLNYGQTSHIQDTPSNRLDTFIKERVQNSEVKNAVWAVSVRDTSGTEVFGYNSNQLMRIASNSKLFVSAVILDELGADFTFKTGLYSDGVQADSIWKGNFFFQGSGDPSINGVFYDENPFFVFDYFIDNLIDRGITTIQGDLYGNESLFDDIRYPKGWEWDDLSYYYAPEISALSFNRNCVDLTVRAIGQPGDRPLISWFPFDTDYVTFVNEQFITPANVSYNESYARMFGSNTILLRSTLPVGYLETESLSITDPAYYFIDTFKKYAEKRGVDWTGNIYTEKFERDWSRLEEIAVHESEPLSRMIHRMNAKSDNFYTEMLVKALAAYTLNVTGTTETGLDYIEDWLISKGIPKQDFQFKDASGMASANLSTATNVTKLLTEMMNHSDNDVYLHSFARPGKDGTLSNRLLGSPVLGNLRAKSGYIAGVRTLSGYLNTSNGNTYSFSIFTNNFTSKIRTVDEIHEAFLEELYHSF